MIVRTDEQKIMLNFEYCMCQKIKRGSWLCRKEVMIIFVFSPSIFVRMDSFVVAGFSVIFKKITSNLRLWNGFALLNSGRKKILTSRKK